MPHNHWVLVAERKSANPRKRQREIIYATDSQEQAKTDAKLMQLTNAKMRYYVMRYTDMLDVAEDELKRLEKALSDARAMKQSI